MKIANKHLSRMIWIVAALHVGGCSSAVLTYYDDDPKPDHQVKKTEESVAYYLPIGRVETDGAWNKDSNAFVFTVTPSVSAQHGRPYWVKRKANPFFDDTMVLAVNNKGLLQTANATTQDQTAAIFAGLISAAGSALTFGAGLSPAGIQKANVKKEGPIPDDQGVLPSVFQDMFDPAKDHDGRTNTYWLETPGAPGNLRRATLFSVSVKCIGSASTPGIPPDDQKRPLEGVIVRLNIPYEVSIRQEATATRPVPPKSSDTGTGNGSNKQDDEQAKKAQEAEAAFAAIDHWSPTGEPPLSPRTVATLIPDSKHSYVLPLSRVPAVSRETDVALVDGSLQSLTMKRPSLILGIASIPQTILTALVPIPLNIRQSAANNVQAVDTQLKAAADIKKLQGQ